MNIPLNIIFHTANILGIFSDPFEFEGDYGPEVNPSREKVFELLVSKEALVKNLPEYTPEQLDQAIEEDSQHGPTLSELVTPELLQELANMQRTLQSAGFSPRDLEAINDFIHRFGSQKLFRFLRNNPPALLSLDWPLRDQASQHGRPFDLPIVSSPQPLQGKKAEELKKTLMTAVFTPETFALTKPESLLKAALEKLQGHAHHPLLGEQATPQDLAVFCSPAGQVFFYWLYQAMNLHLISEDPAFIKEVNRTKIIFAQTLGNAEVRARIFRKKLLEADSGVVFTQESDSFVPQVLASDGPYLPVDRQNPKDGTFVFLRSDKWESDYEIVPIDSYEGYLKGRMNLVLATLKGTQEKFLLISGHGHSTRAEDGRLQISLAMEMFHQLSEKYAGLQLVIGIDANTKTEEDVRKFREHIDALGLVATSVGPTTIKRRLVTAQHSKAARLAVDEEDYLLTLKPESGGHYELTSPTVGFSEEKPDRDAMLPNINNLSDHYPVGATLSPLSLN